MSYHLYNIYIKNKKFIITKNDGIKKILRKKIDFFKCLKMLRIVKEM